MQFPGESPLLAALRAPELEPWRGLLDAFFTTRQAALLCDGLPRLQSAYFFPSRTHGQNHNERVMLYGAMLAAHEDFSQSDTALLLDACAYHDIGRVDDTVDDWHGRRSARRIGDVLSYPDPRELRVLRAMMEAHARDDRLMDGILVRYGVDDLPRARRLALALKDADGLDRVRVDLLDPRYLRFEFSRGLVDFAWALYRAHRRLLFGN